MFLTKMHLPRRTFLRSLGAAIALPLLDSDPDCSGSDGRHPQLARYRYGGRELQLRHLVSL